MLAGIFGLLLLLMSYVGMVAFSAWFVKSAIERFKRCEYFMFGFYTTLAVCEMAYVIKLMIF